MCCFPCRHLNSTTEHNLLMLTSFQKRFYLISGSPETFLSQTSIWGKNAYDCYGLIIPESHKKKENFLLIMSPHETKHSSVLWNHWKGTKLSLETEGSSSGSDWRRKGRGLVNRGFYEEFPPLKAQSMIPLFNLPSSRDLKFAIFAHNLLNTEHYSCHPDVASLDLISGIVPWLYKTPRSEIQIKSQNGNSTACYCVVLLDFSLCSFSSWRETN